MEKRKPVAPWVRQVARGSAQILLYLLATVLGGVVGLWMGSGFAISLWGALRFLPFVLALAAVVIPTLPPVLIVSLPMLAISLWGLVVYVRRGQAFHRVLVVPAACCGLLTFVVTLHLGW